MERERRHKEEFERAKKFEDAKARQKALEMQLRLIELRRDRWRPS